MSPTDPEVEMDQDTRVRFHGNYSTAEQEAFIKAQRSDEKAICKFFIQPLSDAGEIQYAVFDTREGKQKTDPHHSISRASARFAENTVYRYWNPDNDPHYPHEITHLVAHGWSKPYTLTTTLDTADGSEIERDVEMVSTSFMQEGLAIAADEIVFNRKLLEEGERKYPDDWCRDNIDEIPSLGECINLDGFGSFDNKVVVPFSASLAKFLITKYGLKKFKKTYIETKETNSSQANIKVVEKIYEMSEKELLKTWKNNLYPE